MPFLLFVVSLSQQGLLACRGRHVRFLVALPGLDAQLSLRTLKRRKGESEEKERNSGRRGTEG
jgi:hypothetical protein